MDTGWRRGEIMKRSFLMQRHGPSPFGDGWQCWPPKVTTWTKCMSHSEEQDMSLPPNANHLVKARLSYRAHGSFGTLGF